MLKSHVTIKFDLQYLEDNLIEEETILNELMELNNSYGLYYIENNSIVDELDSTQLIDAYEFITNEFYLEVHRSELDSIVDNSIIELEDFYTIED